MSVEKSNISRRLLAGISLAPALVYFVGAADQAKLHEDAHNEQVISIANGNTEAAAAYDPALQLSERYFETFIGLGVANIAIGAALTMSVGNRRDPAAILE